MAQSGKAFGAGAFDRETAARLIEREMAAARAFLGADADNATALLPILHALQGAFGYVDARAVEPIAAALNVSQAEVRGAISFYHDFRAAPSGRRVLKLCRAEACQARGGEDIAAWLEERHALRPGETSPDGALTLENVYCLGNCALGPAALIDDEPLGRLDRARVDALVAGSQP